MRLVMNPDDTYIHKVLVVAYESDVLAHLTIEAHDPFSPAGGVWRFSPLGKAPLLILDNGKPLYGGLQVCEYLDSLNGGPRLFPAAPARWDAYRLMVLGDGMFDATALMRVEGRRPPAERHRDYLLRERRKVLQALEALEAEVTEFSAQPFHIGHICIAGGVSYLATRNPIGELALEPGDERFDWRTSHPRLAAWYDEVVKRPSIAFKLNYKKPA